MAPSAPASDTGVTVSIVMSRQDRRETIVHLDLDAEQVKTVMASLRICESAGVDPDNAVPPGQLADLIHEQTQRQLK